VLKPHGGIAGLIVASDSHVTYSQDHVIVT